MPDIQFNPEEKAVPSVNPLAQYYRQPKVYLRLPSKGQFYPQGALDVSETGEYAVFAMTAKDELMFKTPDALLNGQSTVEVIKSCIPAIRNPWKMPGIDVDACLVAIRIATFGESMEIRADCPSCGHISEYEFKLLQYLESLASFDFHTHIQVGDLIVNIRPYSYQEITKSAIKAIEQQKIFEVINNDQLSEEEKLEKFGVSFVKLTELTVDVVCGCIESIDTPSAKVTDQKFIKEFINNSPSDVFEAISKHINEMKNQIDMKEQAVHCQECNHQYDVTVTMDQSNFFAVRS